MKKKYVVDTHSLLWYFSQTGRVKLSLTAKRIIAGIFKGEAIGYISGVVVAEAICALLKEERKQHKTGIVDKFISRLFFYHKSLVMKEITIEHCLALRNFLGKEYMVGNKKMRMEIHDSLIVLLALKLGCPVITKDEVITASGLTKVIW